MEGLAGVTLHRLVRWIARRALRWFYRETTIVGAENVPASGPVLLVGNHPNDLPDILLGLVATTRPIRYVANASAAESPIVARIYAGVGAIAVTRVRDARKLRETGQDMMAANERAFEQIRFALAAGDLIGLFPEGHVHPGPEIGSMRRGVAQLALQCSASGAVPGIQLVGIGAQYEAGQTPDSDALAVIGEPVDLDKWVAGARDGAQSSFPAELVRILSSVARTAATFEEGLARDRTLAAAAGALRHDISAPSPMAAAHRLREAWPALRHDAAAMNAVMSIGNAVEKAGGRATSARDCTRLANTIERESASLPISAILLAPISLIGRALHAPAFRMAWRLAQENAEVPTDPAAKAIVPGLYLIFGWYAVFALVLFGLMSLPLLTPSLMPDSLRNLYRSLGYGLPALITAAFVMLLPRLGDAAVYGRRAWTAFRFERCVRDLPKSERNAVQSSLLTLRQAWLSHRDG